ncbi:protein mab-21-like 3 [Bombina bombina]|uniref:protein mab-21-like 3 n=1 Tax=Bombina bombina TaxID=8345 RepID=UPI00235B0480|nr:protein mab-21-like 3 [Bombina bombina]
MAMKDLTEEDLHNLLMSSGNTRQRRVSRMVEEVQSIMQRLTSEISIKDSRFQSICKGGIYSDNLKVLSPSQFLVTVPLWGLSGFKQRKSRRWRYYTPSGVRLMTPVMGPEKLHQWLEIEQFKKGTCHWHESDVNIQGDLVPARVISVFQKLLHNAIPFCSLSDKVSVLESSGPVLRVSVETSEQLVEVELVPAVEIPGYWPRKARWPRFLARWPSKERARCIKSFGFDLLARTNYHWQFSFLRAERLLLEEMDEDGGCRMKCLRAVRQLKEDIWCPASQPVITSHHLQMIVLWACEKHPSTKAWKDFARCFLRVVRRLLKCSKQRFLRHYFIRNANLLKNADATQLDILAGKLVIFLKNPSIKSALYTVNSSVC